MKFISIIHLKPFYICKKKMSTPPLAERLRPKNLDDYIGQSHLVGKGSVLRKMLESGNVTSFILWGPPGVGKTTLAKIISNNLNRPFHILSAVNSGVKDVREVIEKAKSQHFFSSPSPILFIDEIHRFSKSQQDSLLSAVEQGVVTLIGATTENPSFEVISPLLSRCQVYILKSLEKPELEILLNRALTMDTELKALNIKVEETEAIFRFSGGDARKLLNVIELVVNASDTSTEIVINNQMVTEKLQQNLALYDKNGEQHYDIISAFIKSIRGSDPNAAVYWLARMVEGGEDPKFIARRLLILAAEDIGLANPNALLLATSCFQAVSMVGWPESRIILSETALYLATSPKSNSAIAAIDTAQQIVRQTGNLPVPLHIRNAPTSLMKDLGYGKDYKYAHSFAGNFAEQEFLPDDISGTPIYKAQNNPKEAEIDQRMNNLWGNKYKSKK
jgi:putative ATPase